jgi:hypothetical protein
MQLGESHVLHRARDRADVTGMIGIDQDDADGHGNSDESDEVTK